MHGCGRRGGTLQPKSIGFKTAKNELVHKCPLSNTPLQGVRVVSQTEHAEVDCVTATGAFVGIRKSAVVQVEFRLGDPD